MKVLLPLTVTTVVTICWVLLLTDVETDTVGLLEAEDLESVDATPPVDGPDVEDNEDWEFVVEDWEVDDGTDDGAMVVLSELLVEGEVAVVNTEELGDIVEGEGDDEEPEVALELADEVGVGVDEAPVLRAPMICRRWRAASTLEAVVIESSERNRKNRKCVTPELNMLGDSE